MSNLTLTLDCPDAIDAVADCIAQLRRWAREAREQKQTADGDEFGDLTPTAAARPAPQGGEYAHRSRFDEQ